MKNQMSKQAQTIYRKALDVAGAILEDDGEEARGTSLSERISRAASWSNLGTDGDLSSKDRAKLRRLAEDAKAAGY